MESLVRVYISYVYNIKNFDILEITKTDDVSIIFDYAEKYRGVKGINIIAFRDKDAYYIVVIKQK